MDFALFPNQILPLTIVVEIFTKEEGKFLELALVPSQLKLGIFVYS